MSAECPICRAEHRREPRKGVPTVKTLLARLPLEQTTADPAALARQLRHVMQHCEHFSVMRRLDELLDTHGVESCVGTDRGRNTASFDYCNTGDTYDPTIVRDTNRRFKVTSWGDELEAMERRGVRFDGGAR